MNTQILVYLHSHHALEPAMLIPERARPLRVVDLEPAVLPPPLLQRLTRNAVAAYELAGLSARGTLLQNRDDLFVRKATLAHRSSVVRIGKNSWIRGRGSRHYYDPQLACFISEEATFYN